MAHVTSADIVRFLNAQRAANGLPAGIIEDPALSAGCFTSSWLRAAAGSWTATSNPFEDRPGSLVRLLAPRLDRMGAATHASEVCAALPTSLNGPAPPTDVVYTYPGDGATDWWTRHWADVEVPTDQPGEFHVEKVAVGPVLYAFFDGPGLTPAATVDVTEATLTGPGGTLPVDASVTTTPTAVELTPHDRLHQFTTYTTTVSADVTPEGGGAARPFARTWSFTTGGLENGAFIDTFGREPDGGLWVGVASQSHTATVTATGPGTPAAAPVDFLIPSSPWSPAFAYVKLDRLGTWHVCLSSGGPGTDYRLTEYCADVTAGPGASLPLSLPTLPDPPPTPAGTQPSAPPPVAPALLTFAAGAHARLLGRTLTVPVRCAASCRLSARGTITAGARRYALPAATTRGTATSTTVRIRLSRLVATRVRAAKPRKVALTITAKPASGSTETYKKTLPIR
jgi:hypothetical protein